jgi:hypothetical protein
MTEQNYTGVTLLHHNENGACAYCGKAVAEQASDVEGCNATAEQMRPFLEADAAAASHDAGEGKGATP